MSEPIIVKSIPIVADRPDKNNRLYPLKLVEAIASDVNKRAKDRRLMGGIGPGSGSGAVKFADVSHVILPTAHLEGRKLVVEARILDTPAGRHLRALLDADTRCTLKLAPRGVGSLVNSACAGVKIVSDDYRLSSFDFVDNESPDDAVTDPTFKKGDRIVAVCFHDQPRGVVRDVFYRRGSKGEGLAGLRVVVKLDTISKCRTILATDLKHDNIVERIAELGRGQGR